MTTPSGTPPPNGHPRRTLSPHVRLVLDEYDETDLARLAYPSIGEDIDVLRARVGELMGNLGIDVTKAFPAVRVMYRLLRVQNAAAPHPDPELDAACARILALYSGAAA